MENQSPMEEKPKITLHYHKIFYKHLLRYSQKKKAIGKALELFQKDVLNPSLNTHKLMGELAGYWSFSVDYHLRILFRIIDKENILLLDIGTHEIYR